MSAPTKPTVDRKKVEALVREALAREIGAAQAAARDVESAGALLIPPDRGVNIGEPYDPRIMPGLLASTPARIGVGRVGPRYHTNTMLRFRADHAAAKDAVLSEVEPALLAELGMFEVASRAPDKPTFLQRPDLGRASGGRRRWRSSTATACRRRRSTSTFASSTTRWCPRWPRAASATRPRSSCATRA
jgi:ethanolamine ammonia-lyase small subunit